MSPTLAITYNYSGSKIPISSARISSFAAVSMGWMGGELVGCCRVDFYEYRLVGWVAELNRGCAAGVWTKRIAC